jgi:hypothetical protein
MSAWPRIGIAQHRALWPTPEHIEVNWARLVGLDGGFAQSRSTKPRTSVAQHWRLLVVPVQRVGKGGAACLSIILVGIGSLAARDTNEARVTRVNFIVMTEKSEILRWLTFSMHSV